MYKFKELLLSLGIIDEIDLESIDSFQILEKHMLDADMDQMDILLAYEFLYQVPYIPLQRCNVEFSLFNKIEKSKIHENTLIPIKKRDGKLVVALSSPFDKIEFAGDDVDFVLGDKEYILKLINQNEMQKNLLCLNDYKNTNVNSINIYLDYLICEAVKLNASDMHIEPQKNNCRVRFRIDGDLAIMGYVQKNIYDFLISRIKVISNLDISKKRIVQEGRISFEIDEKNIDIRVSIMPIIYGEKVVMRILNNNIHLIKKENLGFDRDDIKFIEKCIHKKNGLVLIAGPTGSGKTTTLYAMLNEINFKNRNITTIEDPVEFKIDGINQIQIDDEIGMSFKSALKSVLRQDPDVLMLGEIRDFESADIALKSAITGHLVLSTIHTNRAIDSIVRLKDIGIKAYLIKDSLVAVIAQRLVKRICDFCRCEYVPSDVEIDKANLNIDSIFYKGTGCIKCNNTGNFGRVGVYEVLEINSDIKRCINEDIDSYEIEKICRKYGFKTLKKSCENLMTKGVISIDEYIKIVNTGGF